MKATLTMSTPDPTASFGQALLQVLAAGSDGEPVAHDLSNAADAAFLQQLAARSGMTPERYPGLFALLRGERTAPRRAEAAQDYTGDFLPAQLIDYLGPTGSGLAQAAATFTRTSPIDSVTVWLEVINQAPGETTVLASGVGMAFLAETLRVTTDDSTALPLPREGINDALLTWVVEYQDGSTEVSSQASRWAYQTDGDPVVEAPVQKPDRHTGDPTAIVIGLARGAAPVKTDVDYWFWQTQWENTTLLVPLKGSMKFRHEIAPLNANNPIPQFFLARKEGGMSELKAAGVLRYLPHFSIDPNDPTKLNFELLAGPSSAGNAINFGLSPWVSDTRTYFTCRVFVTFQNAPVGERVGWSSILSSDKPDADAVDGVTYIKPIVYVWHCLAAGTQVTLADGSTRAIEDFTAGDQVQSGGGPRVVLATLAQPHWGTVLVITTRSGRSITCSGTHPFFSSGELVAAAGVQVGQTLDTPDGSDVVTGITQRQNAGEGLFNLWLDPGAPGATSFIANGFVVGDYQLQVLLLDAGENPGQVRERLPRHLRRDFDSYLEDRAAAA